MANAIKRSRPHFRYDDLFFSGMAGVALIVILVGFARTYFLAEFLLMAFIVAPSTKFTELDRRASD